jgi:PqqD family protein of HPr-rel-A system
MDNALIRKILKVQIAAKKQIELSITGVSMNPILFEGDNVIVQRCDDYNIGDILVFTYKTGELLIHRLLLKRADKYFCKGDNAFRLEDIEEEQIIGKVVSVNGRELVPYPRQLTELSYRINRTFFRCRYDAEKTKQTDIFKLYEKTILKKEERIMIYRKNEEMDYIQSSETSLAVYDPKSGDTHFFDETGIDILNILSEPRDIDVLIKKLCEMYSASPDDIRDDVEEFLDEVVKKKVVEII